MVCHRCVLAIEDILHDETIPYHKVIYGEVHLCNELTQDQKLRLEKRFESIGFELIEKIKQFVIKRARNEISGHENKIKLSHYISRQVNHEYTYQSSLFSSVEVRTIKAYP